MSVDLYAHASEWLQHEHPDHQESLEAEKSLLKAMINNEPLSDENLQFIEQLMNEERGDITASERWEIDLSMSVLLSDDINLQLWGLTHLNIQFNDRIDQSTNQPVLLPETKFAVLNEAILSDKSSLETLLLVAAICMESDDSNQCDLSSLTRRLHESGPDNLNVYALSLVEAVEQKDPDQVITVLSLMSRSKYSQLIIPLPDQLKDHILRYMESHPIPELFLRSVGFHEIPLLDQNQVLNVLYRAFYTSVLMQASPINFYRSLIKACEDQSTDKTTCLAISDRLIGHSDTVLAVHMGLSTKELVQKSVGTEQELIDIQEQRAAYKKYQQCLMDIHFKVTDASVLLSDEVIQLTINSQHEGTLLEQTSIYLYEQLEQANPGAYEDPSNCRLLSLNDG